MHWVVLWLHCNPIWQKYPNCPKTFTPWIHNWMYKLIDSVTWKSLFHCMNMLNSGNLEFENRLLLVLTPKPKTEPNRNIDSQKPVWNRFGILRFLETVILTLQTRRLSSLVGWWWTASGGKISIQMTLTMTWTKTIPEQMMICDFGDIRVGFWADFLEALKIR